jgi:hypothetical protein
VPEGGERKRERSQGRFSGSGDAFHVRIPRKRAAEREWADRKGQWQHVLAAAAAAAAAEGGKGMTAAVMRGGVGCSRVQ